MNFRKDKTGFNLKIGLIDWLTVTIVLLVFTDQASIIPLLFDLVISVIKVTTNSII